MICWLAQKESAGTLTPSSDLSSSFHGASSCFDVRWSWATLPLLERPIRVAADMETAAKEGAVMVRQPGICDSPRPSECESFLARRVGTITHPAPTVDSPRHRSAATYVRAWVTWNGAMVPQAGDLLAGRRCGPTSSVGSEPIQERAEGLPWTKRGTKQHRDRHAIKAVRLT